VTGGAGRFAQSHLVFPDILAEMLEQTIHRYQNRAHRGGAGDRGTNRDRKHMREAGGRGESLGLTDDELAFYDALEFILGARRFPDT